MADFSIKDVARLARLSLTAAEADALAADFAELLRLADRLVDIDVQDVPPTHHIVPLTNVLRADAEEPSLPQKTVLTAAMGEDGAYLTVPRTFAASE